MKIRTEILFFIAIYTALFFFGILTFKTQNFGASITTINSTDTLKDSRAVINTNFSNLNAGLVATTSSNTWAGTQTFNNTIASNETNIPNGASPSVSVAGDIAIDTTSGQFKWYDGQKTQIITGTTSPSFNLASTTLDAMGKSFNIGTTTLLLKNFPEAMTMIGFYCVASTTGTALVRFGDGTNWTTESICTNGNFTRTTTNNTWSTFGNFIVQASSTAGTVKRITITTILNKTAD